MADTDSIPEGVLEVIAPDGSRQVIRVTHSPFLIGRGSETGNHLQLADRRISRHCAAVVYVDGEFRLEDRGQRRGLFVNGEKTTTSRPLREGDTINFGLSDSYELVFHTGQGPESLPQILSRMEHITTQEPAAGGLRKLSLLLEATALLHSHLPLDSVLGTMVDHAISITDADRGLLLTPDTSPAPRVRLARQRGGRTLPIEGVEPSQNALRLALDQKRGIITEDAQIDQDLQAAQSIIAQRLRAIVVIPLYATAQLPVSDMTGVLPRGELLGVLYLDSRRPAAFSSLERQILDALAVEAASVIDKARLVERERERQRLEQELSIARDIQQALLPREFRSSPFLRLNAKAQPCLTVGGDYFDIFDLGDCTGFLIADVSGKGLGAALLTTMLQGALSGMALGQDAAGVFAHVNRFLCEHSQIERYATVFYASVNKTGRMEFINAGHPSPLLIRGEDVEDAFPAQCFPVGLLPEGTFQTCTFNLEPGDTLVLFSDGVTEAMDPDEEQFGITRLKETIKGRGNDSLEDLQLTILGSVAAFTRGAHQADDITLLLIRYQGAEQRGDAAQSGERLTVADDTKSPTNTAAH